MEQILSSTWEIITKFWLPFFFVIIILCFYVFLKKSTKIKKEKEELYLMGDFLYNRIKNPSSSIAYWLYFIIIVFAIGITGSLISALPSYENGFDPSSTSLSLTGYAVVLLCSSSIELILIDLDTELEAKYENIKKGIIMSGVGLVILSILIGIITYYVNNNINKLSISIFACIVALFFWWVTNSINSSTLKTSLPPTSDETTGGSTTDLSGEIPSGYTD